MTRFCRTSLTFIFSFLLSSTVWAQTYYPGDWGDWEKRAPEELGLNADKIQEAIEFAQTEETDNPRSMEENHYGTFGREPFGDGIGPFKNRGDKPASLLKVDIS